MTPIYKPSKQRGNDHDDALSGDLKISDDDRVYVAAGDVIADKYVVERLLGVGGIGFVVAARHVQLGGYFALKFLKKRYLRQPQIVERFTREARAACRIQNEYIARVYDVGSSDGVPFLVMEYLVGRDLAQVLADGGRLSEDDAVEYAVYACVALSVAHGQGIVHRDIKPENLFRVDHDGLSTIKLLDFGISKISVSEVGSTESNSRLTGSLVLGTPFYMSPEQLRATASADARSDIWSLGVVLYELLSATMAFGGGSVAEICAAILEREPVPLGELRPDLPQGLADVVTRCLQKDPADRFRNVAELALALLPFAPLRALAVAEGSSSIRRAAIHAIGGGTDGLGIGVDRSSRSLRISGALASDPPMSSRRPIQSGPNEVPSAEGGARGRGIVIAGVAAMLAVGVGGAFLFRRPDASGPHPVATAPAAEPRSTQIVTAEPRPEAPGPTTEERAEPGAAAGESAHTPSRVAPRPSAAHWAQAPQWRATAAPSRPAPTPPRASVSAPEPPAPVPPPPPVRTRPDVGY